MSNAPNSPDYKSTLNLPQTEFSMKANLPQREPEQVSKWLQEGTYQKMTAKRKGKPLFVLHDGPPYANGSIHVGHTLNKVLKDVVIKYKNMSGFHAEFIPGWDCHGLPIELGVEKNLKEQKKNKADLSRVEIRKLCREYAHVYIDKQREQFKRLGVFAEWDSPYMTMSSPFVAQIIRELGTVADHQNLVKWNKVVHWCISCGTALADAEIEYADHKSPSIYVGFEITESEKKKHPALSTIKDQVFAVIWTTTPWTLPANFGIALNPELEYALVQVSGRVLIVAEGLREKFLGTLGAEGQLIAKVKAESFQNLEAQHPFMNRPSKFVFGEHVTLEAGTGLVHTAPGHGLEDYFVGKKYGLPIHAPVDANGYYLPEVTKLLPELEGKRVFEANKPIGEHLQQSGHLLKLSFLSHSYPHCWRCNNPIIFRATPQWFITMENTQLRKKAIEQIRKTEWIPQWGINRILGMVESRPDWCVSRQRIWGAPITVFYCKKCTEPVFSKQIFNMVADLVEKHGPDIWYEWPVEKLLPPGTKCKCGESAQFEKETDILDVWFDSGVSHAAVLTAKENAGKVQWPADLFLEGSDQHRGWFQTSLLTAVETRGQAPYRKVLTHGFVNDKDGKKMSKSKGNVVDPMDFTQKYGAEILRLWVIMEDYRNDINFSNETITRIGDSYRKIRNTFRYALGNLYDFDFEKDAVSEFLELDAWALNKTSDFLKRVYAAYEAYEFHTAFHALVNFSSVDLSAQYFDILKDRLYTSKKTSKERRSSQTALYIIATSMIRAFAPLLSFTSEEVWSFLKQPGSVFEADFPILDSFWKKDFTVSAAKLEKILSVREVVLKELENARAAKSIGHPLEASLKIQAPEDVLNAVQGCKEDLARIFIVSAVEWEKGDQVRVQVQRASGEKCARCWVYSQQVGKNTAHPALCNKCIEAIS